MNIEQLVRATRTCRRFQQHEPIAIDTLRWLVELARLGGSARNLQPLKYLLVSDPELNAAIFPHLGWAGYLPEWPGPAAEERPAAYVICLLDTRLAQEAECDLGIATQNLLLGATSRGLAGCRIGSFSGKLHGLLDLAAHLKILLVIALGKPLEEVHLEELPPDGSIRYWHDAAGVHHVPKRPLADLIVTTGKG